jgi:large subunit ribosomal protein L3
MRGGLLAKKRGMTQIYRDDGTCIPVTVLEVGPCQIVQKKTFASDGYDAVQIGFGEGKESRLTKSKRGHCRAHKAKNYRYLREFRTGSTDSYQVGQFLDVSLFKVGDYIDVVGRSKGKGFQGVMKRHGFKGGPGAHGSRFHRIPGSIGQCTFPGEVQKGRKLPGRMGHVRVTVQGLKIVAVRSDENILLARGAVPGSNQGIVFVRMSNENFDQRVQALTDEAEKVKQEAELKKQEAADKKKAEQEAQQAAVAEEAPATEAPSEQVPSEEAAKEEIKIDATEEKKDS